MSPLHDFSQHSIVRPIVEQLRGGITADKIALAMLCALAAMVFRLNQPIIQMTNYLVYPLQLALLLGFYRAGEWLFGRPHLPLSIGLLMQKFRSGPLQFIGGYGMLAVRGIAVWAIAAPVVFGMVLFLVRTPLRALAVRHAGARI